MNAQVHSEVIVSYKHKVLNTLYKNKVSIADLLLFFILIL